MDILILADIHGNYPALLSIATFFKTRSFDLIVNCGDSTVYGPFPNETLQWLKQNEVISILGNTDRKVIQLLQGKTFTNPKKKEKRIMYTWTRDVLMEKNRYYLLNFKESASINLNEFEPGLTTVVRVFHGSPEDTDEFLFDSTPMSRFRQLATSSANDIFMVGHSHTPFHKIVGSNHFINPGSVGRMFDGDTRAGCATLTTGPDRIDVQHYRISYPIQQVVDELKKNNLPDIYVSMFLLGKKLN